MNWPKGEKSVRSCWLCDSKSCTLHPFKSLFSSRPKEWRHAKQIPQYSIYTHLADLTLLCYQHAPHNWGRSELGPAQVSLKSYQKTLALITLFIYFFSNEVLSNEVLIPLSCSVSSHVSVPPSASLSPSWGQRAPAGFLREAFCRAHIHLLSLPGLYTGNDSPQMALNRTIRFIWKYISLPQWHLEL